MKTETEHLEPKCCVCGYCLRGLPPDWKCPECGTPTSVKKKPSPPLLYRCVRLAVVAFMLGTWIIGAIGWRCQQEKRRSFWWPLGREFCFYAYDLRKIFMILPIVMLLWRPNRRDWFIWVGLIIMNLVASDKFYDLTRTVE